MKEEGLLKRYADKIEGVLGCYDRVVVSGTLMQIAHPEAMSAALWRAGVRCFDLGQYVEPLREEIRGNAERLAKENGLAIQYLENRRARKEDVVAEIVAKRGRHPGLVCVFSAMENCTTFRPWHDKKTGKTGLKFAAGKCLHYYFYLIDPELDLMYVRVPTWAPYRLQVYFNGHNWLGHRLAKARMDFRLEDNAFVTISDWARAQAMSEEFSVHGLHQKLAALARILSGWSPGFRAGSPGSMRRGELPLWGFSGGGEARGPF